MKPSKLRKDVIKSIRINSENLSRLESKYGSIQKIIDALVDNKLKVKITGKS